MQARGAIAETITILLCTLGLAEQREQDVAKLDEVITFAAVGSQSFDLLLHVRILPKHPADCRLVQIPDFHGLEDRPTWQCNKPSPVCLEGPTSQSMNTKRKPRLYLPSSSLACLLNSSVASNALANSFETDCVNEATVSTKSGK